MLLVGIGLVTAGIAAVFAAEDLGHEFGVQVTESKASWSSETDLRGSDMRASVQFKGGREPTKGAIDGLMASAMENYKNRVRLSRRMTGRLAHLVGPLVWAKLPEDWARGTINVQIERVSSNGSDFWPLHKGGTDGYTIEIKLDITRRPHADVEAGEIRTSSPTVAGTIRIEGEHTLIVTGVAPRATVERIRAETLADVIASALLKSTEIGN